MKILILEPYFTGSHKAWAEGYQAHSGHTIDILSMKGQFWKWRMHGGAITLAREFRALKDQPDLILGTSMVDLSTFKALTGTMTAHTPTAIYFHENQLSYPWSPTDRDILEKRDKHYGFINLVSALTADSVYFNSQYHMDSFLKEAKRLLKHFPDYNELGTIDAILKKSSVLYLGLDLARFDAYQAEQVEKIPLILWNHRWEYDKNPEDFFKALFLLQDKGLQFNVAILGENFSQSPDIFDEAKISLKQRIVQFGYCHSFQDYAQWLWRADILPVTNIQEFFGISVMEAVYCNAFPLFPDRLTYPELFPMDGYPQHFYTTFDDLIDKLQYAIENIAELRKNSLGPIARKFSWELMAPVYDQKFADLIK